MTWLVCSLLLIVVNAVLCTQNEHPRRVKVKIYDHRAEHDPKEQYGRGPWNYYGYGYGLEYQYDPDGKYQRQKGYGYVRAYGRDFCKFADKSKCPEHVRQYARDKYSDGGNKLESEMFFPVPPLMPISESSKVLNLPAQPAVAAVPIASQRQTYELPRSLLLTNIVEKPTSNTNELTHTGLISTNNEHKDGRIPVSDFRSANMAASTQALPPPLPVVFDLVAAPLYPLPPPSIGYSNGDETVPNKSDPNPKTSSKIILDRLESGQSSASVQSVDQLLQPRSSSPFFMDETDRFQEPPLKKPSLAHPPDRLVKQSPQIMMVEFERNPTAPLRPSSNDFDDAFNNREREFFSPRMPESGKDDKVEENDEEESDDDDNNDGPQRRMFTGRLDKKGNGSKKQKLLNKSKFDVKKSNDVAGRAGAASVLPLIKAVYPAFVRS